MSSNFGILWHQGLLGEIGVPHVYPTTPHAANTCVIQIASNMIFNVYQAY